MIFSSKVSCPNFVRTPQASGAAKAEEKAGTLAETLPIWRLDDLYSGLDSPQYAQDVETVTLECRQFAATWRGALAGVLAGGDAPQKLYEAIAAYEKIDDLITKIMSFAGLSYAENTVDPARAKFYGDAQEKITTASTDLLFFQLELNRLDDSGLEAAMAQAPLSHYRPWLEDLRKEKPFQLEDRIEQLFHEKSVTGHGAWNRLFDETIAALRFNVDGEDLTLEPTLNLFQDPDPALREKASNAIAATLKANLRIFGLISNVLAKDKAISDQWRGFSDVAQSRHLSNRVEPEVVEAMVAAVRAAYPRLSHRYYGPQGALARQGQAQALGPQRASARRAAEKLRLGAGARRRARRLWRIFAAHGRDRAKVLRPPVDRRAGAARQGAGRFRPSDLDLGPPLRAAQLSGQAARRDDAGA